ncbi:MAG TPA: FAD-binding oxidoreductase [Thermomicrobiales bacterium]|nr:FAD-binding oxidoreductase [Thermomicrobiales bacterium]
MTATAPALHTWLPNVDGFGRLVAPHDSQSVAATLADCVRDGQTVVPVGGGGALGLGNLTDPGALALSTLNLNQILSYEATDMTLSVQAGVSLATIQGELGKQGQMLPIEAPHPETATIGGLLATALTGPRRYGGGTLRDVLIGIEVAYPDGTVGKAGGMVVKNVSGFDMMRLHYGALGTLGIITSANFKVLARPRAEVTYISRPLPFAEAIDLGKQLRPLENRPVALVINRSEAGWTVSARFEGRMSGLTAVESRIAPLFAEGITHAGPDSSEYWQEIMDNRAYTGEQVLRLQIGGRPATITSEARRIVDTLESKADTIRDCSVEPGLGQILVTLTEPLPSLETLRGLLGTDLTLRIHEAPLAYRQGIDIWGETPQTIDLMQRLRREYDPTPIINPGRFAGRL